MNVRFEDNVCTQAGDDVGGGALYVLGGVSTVDGEHVPEEPGRERRRDRLPRRRRDRPRERPDDPGLRLRRQRDAGPGLELRGDGGRALRRRRGRRRGAGRALHLPRQRRLGGGRDPLRDVPEPAGARHRRLHVPRERRDRRQTAARSTTRTASLTFTGSLVAGNRAFAQGGGLWLYHPTAATITNVTFTGNRAEGAVAPSGYAIGGAFSIYPSGPNVTLSHLTVTHNHAGWTGGGITVASPASNVTIRASIVAHNTAANGGNPWNIGKNCDVGSPQMTSGGDVIEFPQRNLGDGNDENCVAGPGGRRAAPRPARGPRRPRGDGLAPRRGARRSTGRSRAAGPRWMPAARRDPRECAATWEPSREPSPPCASTPSPPAGSSTRASAPACPSPRTARSSFDAAGTCGVPADARALAVNLTGVVPAADGVLRLFGAGQRDARLAGPGLPRGPDACLGHGRGPGSARPVSPSGTTRRSRRTSSSTSPGTSAEPRPVRRRERRGGLEFLADDPSAHRARAPRQPERERRSAPTAPSASTRPPCRATMRRTMARPTPSPLNSDSSGAAGRRRRACRSTSCRIRHRCRGPDRRSRRRTPPRDLDDRPLRFRENFTALARSSLPDPEQEVRISAARGEIRDPELGVHSGVPVPFDLAPGPSCEGFHVDVDEPDRCPADAGVGEEVVDERPIRCGARAHDAEPATAASSSAGRHPRGASPRIRRSPEGERGDRGKRCR